MPAIPRILLVDDNRAIHDDIRKILDPHAGASASLKAMEADLFDETPTMAGSPRFQIDSAYQGQEGLELLKTAMSTGTPYAVAFVDVRMPPGWDGVETISHLWREDPDLQVVICTAYSDHSWQEIMSRLAPTDGMLILRKPFDSIEIRQMVHALSAKWTLRHQVRRRVHDLEDQLQARTRDLTSAHERVKRETAELARLEMESQFSPVSTNGVVATAIAGEITGATQTIAGELRSLHTAFTQLGSLVDAYRQLIQQMGNATGQGALVQQAQRAAEAANLTTWQIEIPRVLERTAQALQRAAVSARSLTPIQTRL